MPDKLSAEDRSFNKHCDLSSTPPCFFRGIIQPVDIGRFDSMVSQEELKAYEELATKQEYKKPLLCKEEDLLPPAKTLMAAVPGMDAICFCN